MQVGRCKLRHRIAMAPMSRCRADNDGVPLHLMEQYYGQRASVPGTLIISESTCVSKAAGGRYINAPGIFSAAQIEGWKNITRAVHDKGSFIFAQLWAVGRAGRQEVLDVQGIEMISSSAIAIKEGNPIPRPLTNEEIEMLIRDYAVAARNAMEAGFDGVEVHAANGYLIDQFLQDTCNHRADLWGGSIDNRARLCLEVLAEVIEAVGADRTGVRLSPYSPYQGMGMKDTEEQFSYLLRKLRPLSLAYLHLVHSRIHGVHESLDFVIEQWDKDSPLLLNGGYDRKQAEEAVQMDRKVAIAFGRDFVSNPDLPFRLKENLDLNAYDPSSFYAAQEPSGYIDYPFHKRFGGMHEI